MDNGEHTVSIVYDGEQIVGNNTHDHRYEFDLEEGTSFGTVLSANASLRPSATAVPACRARARFTVACQLYSLTASSASADATHAAPAVPIGNKDHLNECGRRLCSVDGHPLRSFIRGMFRWPLSGSLLANASTVSS